jgi:hypothetical protein
METFAPVPGYEGFYEVSNLGTVRSVERTIDCKRCGLRKFDAKVLSAKHHNKGYLKVSLYKAGSAKTYFIHRLVLHAFKGQPPADKPYARHLDGNPKNNRLENLDYGSQTDNENDKRNHGTWHLRGPCYA